jgi:hypothetical protein
LKKAKAFRLPNSAGPYLRPSRQGHSGAIATDNLGATYKSLNVEVIVTFTTDSISLNSSEILNLYPNPNNGLFSINLFSPFSTDNNKVTIISLSGKTVYDDKIAKDVRFKQFDLSKSASGTYIFMITDGKTVTIRKIIKN